MVTGADVLQMLRPEGGWIIHDNDFEKIQWLECEPLTKKQYEAGFAKYEAWKEQKETDKAKAKADAEAKLEALGIKVDDLRALLF